MQPVEKVLWPNTRFVEDRVEADFNSGVRSGGVLGTPSFFVNGVLHDGPVTVRGFLDALRREPVPRRQLSTTGREPSVRRARMTG